MNNLNYGGAAIRDRDDHLCLTDMWRAAGSDPSKQPAKWREHDGTKEFVSYIAETLRWEESFLFAAKEGRNGGTWAHWQVAMAYAKYLSPEFHAWCNSVVRAHMEGRLAVPGASSKPQSVAQKLALVREARLCGFTKPELQEMWIDLRLPATEGMKARILRRQGDLFDARPLGQA